MTSKTVTTVLAAPERGGVRLPVEDREPAELGERVRPRAEVRGRQGQGRQRPRRVLLRDRGRREDRRDRHVRRPDRGRARRSSPRGSSPSPATPAPSASRCSRPRACPTSCSSRSISHCCASSRTSAGNSPREPAARVDRDDLGFLLAKATQRWNELLAERFAARGYSEVARRTVRCSCRSTRKTASGWASSPRAPA